MVWEEYSTWSSRVGPRSRWKDTKPGTPGRWVSREVQTSSNAVSAPGKTLKRFIAMNMGVSLCEAAGADLRQVADRVDGDVGGPPLAQFLGVEGVVALAREDGCHAVT